MCTASSDSAPTSASVSAPVPAPAGWVIHRPRPPSSASASASASDGTLRIWGLTPAERLRRSLERAGCRSVSFVTPGELPRAEDAVVALRGDVILDERLVRGIVESPGSLLVSDALGPLGMHASGADAPRLVAALADGEDAELASAGLRRLAPHELAPAYIAKLRKREPPYVFAARPDLVSRAEARIFDAAYKGLTDLVTKWVWPRPAAAATGWCAQRGVHPNTVTLWSWALAAAAAALFALGAFLPGLAIAWLMTFLDTVDGKLARVTLTSSRLGDVLDHGLDLLHPPFWWLAWGVGLGPGFALETGIVVGGYVAGRLLEGIFVGVFGFETHSWRPIDGLFRTVTARRNPNLLLLTVGTLAGRPDLGLAMLALWTLASLAFHTLRLGQALALRRRGGEVEPWENA